MHDDSDELAGLDLPQRPRRLRRSESLRRLVREHAVTVDDLIWPLFVTEGDRVRSPVGSMPGVFRLSLDELLKEVERGAKAGLKAVALFPAIGDDLKDPVGSESLNPEGLLPRTVRALKQRFPNVLVMTDVALDPWSSDGHDGVVKNGEILNDETLPLLAGMAVVQAEAGADLVAPSDMMDGRVAIIRAELDAAGFTQTGILAYSAKYCSGFYGPFREALDSAPRSGDKKTYQMDPANRREAIREVLLDVEEGADIVMVKPGLPYLDVVQAVKAAVQVPVAVYQVSGEYAMIKAAAERGWIDGERAMMECLLAMKRAGADLILSYAALEVAELLRRRT